jgi:hypothetical protein
VERGAESDPGYLDMLDLAANHVQRRYDRRIRSARQRQ